MTISQRKLPRAARSAIALTATLAVAIALSACSSTPTTSTPSGSPTKPSGTKALKIGFSAFNLQIPALKGLSDGLTAVAKSQGDTVISADPKGDPSTQLQQIQQWVQLGQVDAIWVIPQAAATVAPALLAAQAKGIVIVASGIPSDYGFPGPEAGMTFTNVDNKDFGGQLGTLAAKCITDNLGGKGQVIYLQSPQGQQSSADINASFLAAIAAGAPNAKIVSKLTAKDRLGSQQEILSAIQGNPGANVVVGTDDESTLGGLDAFGQANKSAASTCVVGAGGNTEAQGDVKSGKIYGDVAFNFQADLVQNLKQLHTLAGDPKAVGTQLTTPIQVITK